jgi:hypothetical protein
MMERGESSHAIEKELLDQLLAGRDTNQVFAKDGLLDDLKKALSERIAPPEEEALRVVERLLRFADDDVQGNLVRFRLFLAHAIPLTPQRSVALFHIVRDHEPLHIGPRPRAVHGIPIHGNSHRLGDH